MHFLAHGLNILRLGVIRWFVDLSVLQRVEEVVLVELLSRGEGGGGRSPRGNLTSHQNIITGSGSSYNTRAL